MKKVVFFLIFYASVCIAGVSAEIITDFKAEAMEVEVGGILPLSCRVEDGKNGFPSFDWTASAGDLVKTAVRGEADFIAPQSSGPVEISVTAYINGKSETRSLTIDILPEGALKKTADVLITVDTGTLQNVWVNAAHSGESFKAPLYIKGTFRYDPDSGLAFAGGSWPSYPMYDDGTHGDAVADDGVWSILMKFEKTDSKVYFAFDDANPYRVEYESGLAWTMKMAWIELDDFPDDHSNPAFTPDKDKMVSWTSAMAVEGEIYNER